MKDISLHLLDIVQNSIRAKASEIIIRIQAEVQSGWYKLSVEDNGCGMEGSLLETVTDPFVTSRTTRKVGLGLPLLKQSAEQSGGTLSIRSEKGKGCSVEATFRNDHIDCLPEGDIAGVMALLITANESMEFIFDYSVPGSSYSLNTREVKEILNGVPLNDPEIYRALKEMIEVNLDELKNI